MAFWPVCEPSARSFPEQHPHAGLVRISGFGLPSALGLRVSAVLCSLLLLAALSSPAATLVAYDPFTDGNRTNTTGGDTQGLLWYMGQTWGTLGVTNDNAGIGSGNALQFTPTAAFGKFLAYFGPVTLTNPGDSVTLSFNFRFTTPPTNINAGFRVGLYNTLGTRQSTDASDTTVPGPGDRSDDVGYGFQTNPGTNSASGLNVYSEGAGNDILGGASPSQTSNQGTAGTSFNFGTNRHFALFQIALQPGGSLALTAYIDNGLAATASIPPASVFTNTFDELAMEEGGSGWYAPWLIDNVVVVTTTANDFDTLRTNWWALQTGGTNYSLTDSLVKSRLTTITNNAFTWMNSMDKSGTNTYLWSDLTSTTDSAQLSTAYQRLQQMALAYATYGCALYTNATLATNVQVGLNWMYSNRYNESIAAPAGEYGNWYDWEIGAPLLIVDIADFMYPALGPTGLSNTLNAVDHFVPSPFSGTSGTSTGGNLTDKIRVVAVRGAVARDASKLTLAANAFSSLFAFVTNGDGFYTDGSFIQHTRHPYTCSYGLVAIQDTALVLPWLVGGPGQYSDPAQTSMLAPWRCTDPAYTNVVWWVYNAYQPLLYYGAAMDMTRGRAVSRYSNQDHTAGASIMQWLLTLGVSQFPATADAAQIKSMVKYLAQVDTFRNFTNNVPLQLVKPTEQLMADSSVVPRGELLGHWTFAGMDRVVHLRPGWGLGLSLSSSRVYNYESINSENLHGWFQGDGVLYLYNNTDLGQFNDDFWPTVDPYKLPGTTVDTAARADAAGEAYLSSKNWVGGATLYTNGVAGLDLDPYGSPLAGKKSWFMFDDEVVCLGAGLTCNNNADVQTTALNRKISSSNTNNFIVGGVTMPTTLGWQTNLTNVSWCALDGTGGCYFPGGATLKALRQARTASWSQINAGGTTSSTTRNYLTLWYDHGTNPANASYSYVLLPNYNTAQVSAYAASPEITILENSTTAQAVKETTLNLVAANFWADGAKTLDLITCSNKAAVFTQESGGMLSVAVADPTQTNTGVISLSLNRAANSIAYLDPGITVTQLRPTIQMTAKVQNAQGRSLVARFNVQNSAPYFLTQLPDTNVGPDLTLTLAPAATDPDLPYQTLSYSLLNGTNASINAANGLFTWTPTVAQAGLSNRFSIVVSDNGSPSLSATQSFTVAVNKLPPATLASTSLPNGHFQLAATGAYGPNYSIQASTNLMDWTTLFTTNQPIPPIIWVDTNAPSFPQRFYRVVLGP